MKQGITYSVGEIRNSHCKIGDLNGNFITTLASYSGYDNSLVSKYHIGLVTPTSDILYYPTLSTNFSSYTKAMIVVGDMPLGYKEYNVPYRQETLNDKTWIDNVIIGSDGDYQKISYAINNIAMQDNNHIINLIVKDGIYTEQSEITLPNNVNIIGESGNRDKCIINFVPTDTSETAITQQSLLKVEKSNDFKNITFTGINCRYVVHCESANASKDWTINIDNCKFIHYKNTLGSWTTQHAWGEGSSSGSRLFARKTEFRTLSTGSQSSGFSVHNNINFDAPMYHQFDNCHFFSNAYSAFRCEGLVSTTEDKCVLNNCYLDSNFYMTNALTIKVECNGCNLVGTNTTSYFDKNSIAYYTDYLIELINNTGDTIPKGSIVAFNGNKNNIKLANADDIIVGFTIGDTPTGEKATIITKGYYNTLDGASLGSKYTVSNGVLTRATDGKVATALGYGWTYVCGQLVN